MARKDDPPARPIPLTPEQAARIDAAISDVLDRIARGEIQPPTPPVAADVASMGSPPRPWLDDTSSQRGSEGQR